MIDNDSVLSADQGFVSDLQIYDKNERLGVEFMLKNEKNDVNVS